MGRQIVDVVATFARGAAVLAAMRLLIVIASNDAHKPRLIDEAEQIVPVSMQLLICGIDECGVA